MRNPKNTNGYPLASLLTAHRCYWILKLLLETNVFPSNYVASLDIVHQRPGGQLLSFISWSFCRALLKFSLLLQRRVQDSNSFWEQIYYKQSYTVMNSWFEFICSMWYTSFLKHCRDVVFISYICRFVDRENELREAKPATPQPPQRAPLDPWAKSRASQQWAGPKLTKNSASDGLWEH